ncbi:unnamed protein product [Rotaria sordida]|uniref:Uncharacterized protein n=1 Tax=Rotaria sordida TaxID=392033 RepID=A0A814E7I5_9BILA|nr:unnamed protein product [Rotaria sordida]CAF1123774.1 unnamed protein product [Rotaria sordida]CAF3563606.1 unnamed protein product [Rotaria sordida]CAF3654855.1 unnamed protein product [Rotaria sordida]
MDINHRLNDVEQSSTVYIHQAEKFHADATHLSSLLEKSFIEAEQFINSRMQILATQNIETNQRLDNEQALLLAIRSKLDTTLTKLTQCHQEAIRLQSNTDSRFRLMINTAKGRLEQVERLKTKMIRYENSLEIASPICEDTNRILSKSDNSTTRKFQDELKHVTEKLKKVIDLGKETRNETQILHGQYDTDVNRHMATLMRHDKTEREQMSILIEHKQSLLREIDWINEQKRIIDNFISKMAPTLDKCLCEGPSINNTNRTVR